MPFYSHQSHVVVAQPSRSHSHNESLSVLGVAEKFELVLFELAVIVLQVIQITHDYCTLGGDALW